ncbi:hypothetical protein Q9L58_007091 [Maublancomyces gigas]|uniref:SMP domain-containing protein n=1 Tax=Discina gigas TaxID=1032678 RepID=A0ABR3GDJ9_9PEZI
MSGKMTKEDSQRIQSSQSKGGHDTGANTFSSRSQSAGDKHQSSAQKSSGGTSGGGGGTGAQAGAQAEGKK